LPIVITQTNDYEGQIEGLLGIMRKVANSFAGIRKDVAKKTETKEAKVTKVGDIYIVSEPNGAVIYIDNKKTAWQTPHLIEGYPVGKHSIELKAGKLSAKSNVVIHEGKIENLTLLLIQPEVPVKIISNPLEAKIFVRVIISEGDNVPAVLKSSTATACSDFWARQKSWI